MLRMRIVASALLFSIIGTACSSGVEGTAALLAGENETAAIHATEEIENPSVSTSPTPTSDEKEEENAVPDWLLAESNPLNLDLTLDENISTAAEIGPEGGTLTLERSDGTIFTLEIPGDALINMQTIVMTSVSEISGVDLEGRNNFTIHMQPEDLLFLKPVRFMIEFPDVVEVNDVTEFSLEGLGDNFHLIPSHFNDNRIETWLTHFSTYGAFYASQGALFELQASYTPTSAEARAEEQIAAIDFAIEDEATQKDAYERILNQWMAHSVLTTMTQAANDDQLLAGAVGEYLAWHQTVQYLSRRNRSEADQGFLARFEDEYAAIYDAMALAFKNAIERAYTNCVQNKNPLEALNLTSWSLLAMNFALDIFGMHGLDPEYITERTSRCLSFELNFSSTAEGRGSDGNGWTTKVSTTLPIEFDQFEFGDNSAFGVTKFLEDSTVLYMDEFNVEVPSSPSISCQYNKSDGEISGSLGIPFTLFREERSFDEVIVYFGFPKPPKELVHCESEGYPVNLEAEFWMEIFSVSFTTGVSSQADQELPKPLKYYVEGNAYIVHLPITNDSGTLSIGREAGQLTGLPGVFVEALYSIVHTPK